MEALSELKQLMEEKHELEEQLKKNREKKATSFDKAKVIALIDHQIGMVRKLREILRKNNDQLREDLLARRSKMVEQIKSLRLMERYKEAVVAFRWNDKPTRKKLKALGFKTMGDYAASFNPVYFDENLHVFKYPDGEGANPCTFRQFVSQYGVEWVFSELPEKGYNVLRYKMSTWSDHHSAESWLIAVRQKLEVLSTDVLEGDEWNRTVELIVGTDKEISHNLTVTVEGDWAATRKLYDDVYEMR